eukprot:7218954-Alexandrium_andersonii.AAC.1
MRQLTIPESFRRRVRLGKSALDKEWARRQWHAVCTNPFWARSSEPSRPRDPIDPESVVVPPPSKRTRRAPPEGVRGGAGEDVVAV